VRLFVVSPARSRSLLVSGTPRHAKNRRVSLRDPMAAGVLTTNRGDPT
jgi:hypothetical protein